MLQPLTSADALALCARLLGLSVALQSAELLLVRSAFGPHGSFPWSVLRADFGERGVLAWLLDALLAYRPFVAVLALQFVLACTLALHQGAAVLLALWLTLLLVAVRFRGSYNGGSDAMTLVVASALCGAALARVICTWAGLDGARIEQVALAYVAAQLVLSYFAAGVAKLRSERWRHGTALSDLVTLRPYYVPPRLRALLKRPGISLLAGSLVVAFELSAPLTLGLGARFACGWLAVSVVFHLSIAVLLGLNRFVWAWLAAYPALLYWSATLHG